jgi:hypothetical protein
MNGPIEAPPTKPNDMYADYPSGPRIAVEALEYQGQRLAFFLTCSMGYYMYQFASAFFHLDLSRLPTFAFIIIGLYLAVGFYFLYRIWRRPRPALWLVLLPWGLQLAIALRYQSAHSSIWLIPVVSGIATVILWKNWKKVEGMKSAGVSTNSSPVERVS